MGIILQNIHSRQPLSYDLQQKSDPQAYAVYLLVNFCMPTLMGMKPSSLIRSDKLKIKDGADFLKVLEKEIHLFGCSLEVLYENSYELLILIYHRIKLLETLADKENKQFLEAMGYRLQRDTIHNVINKLKKEYGAYQKLRASVQSQVSIRTEYPHEVGVVLGFPIEDVKDFIKYNGTDYIICGYWKVYHDVENALKIFEGYRQAREISIKHILEGKKLQDLINISDERKGKAFRSI